MTISLTPSQLEWVDAHIARGEFASVEDAVRQLIEERISERAVEEIDDLAWAKPFVEEALADVGRGEVLSRDEHEARMDAVLGPSDG